MATEIKVGLAGFGNVGKGTYDILERNHSLIRQRAGAPISVKRVTVRNVDRVKLLVDEDVIVTNDWHDLVNDPEVNVVVEAMGGIEPAKSLILAAINAGKHVVTANKALLAEHGNEIFSAALAKGVNVAFEAAVAGSIPIVKALREGLAATESLRSPASSTEPATLSSPPCVIPDAALTMSSKKLSVWDTLKPIRPSTSRVRTPLIN